MKHEVKSPHQWPDALYLEGQAENVESSLWECLSQCDKAFGTLVDLTSVGVEALKQVLSEKEQFSATFVIAISSACPTREADLRQLLHMQDEFQGEGLKLQLRLLPIPTGVTEKARHAKTPPSTLLLQNSKTGSNCLWLGSNGDLDEHRPYHTASLNLLLPLTPLAVDNWCKHFDYVAARAAPLKGESLSIPNLVPARGEIEAAEKWSAYCKSLYESVEADRTAEIKIDPETKEVTAKTADGQAVETASKFNAVQRIPRELSEILPYLDKGSLVSVDEATRIKPLTIPMQSFLFEQRSQTTVGSVTQKQSFSLEILDKQTLKAIEACRKINPTITLFSFSLGKNMHWIPEKAKPLLERELDAMEAAARTSMGSLVTGDIDSWIEKEWPRLSKDIINMYQRLHGGSGSPPQNRVEDVRKEIYTRLEKAISGRIVPKINYSSFVPQLGASSNSVSGLGQILHLLKSAAVDIREPYFDGYYFQRNFSKRGTTLEAWGNAMNAFEDTGPERLNKQRDDSAEKEKQEILAIFGDEEDDEQAKLSKLWALLRREK